MGYYRYIQVKTEAQTLPENWWKIFARLGKLDVTPLLVAQRWCSLIKLSLQSHKSRPTNTYNAHLSDTITNLHTTLYLISLFN